MNKKGLVVPIVAIAVLGGLETVALLNGINGTLFMFSASIIGGIGGYNVKKARSE